jgi:hypothetical protein
MQSDRAGRGAPDIEVGPIERAVEDLAAGRIAADDPDQESQIDRWRPSVRWRSWWRP